MDCVRRDMQALRITPEDAQDRTFWKSRILVVDPTLWEKAKMKKKKKKKGLSVNNNKLDTEAYFVCISAKITTLLGFDI